MKFEVVRLGITIDTIPRFARYSIYGITRSCMRYSARDSPKCACYHSPPGTFWISGLLKSSLMRFLSNTAETCCELAIESEAMP